MKKAFTLSEVLISLTVIGVIAALTIPVISGNTQKTVNAEGCKKAFIILSDAVEMAKAYNPYEKWEMVDSASVANYNRIKKHLNIIKECIDKDGCWTPATKGLNKEAAANFSSQGYGLPPISFKTADGMNVTFDITTEDFNVSRKDSATMIFAVDINGNKGPNRLGDDTFIFVLGDNGLVPAGIDAGGNGDCHRDGAGRDCAARVIREGAINY